MTLNLRHIFEDDEIHLRRKIAESNGWSISFFIDRLGSSTTHASSIHRAKAISDEHYSFLVSSLACLNDLVGVDLKIVDDESLADIKYAHHSYDVTYGDSAGVNSYSYSYGGSLSNPVGSEWTYNDISVNEFDRDVWAYVALHEIGHSLGLEHPFEGDDADSYGSKDSITVDQTIMAYGYPENGIYPDFLRP